MDRGLLSTGSTIMWDHKALARTTRQSLPQVGEKSSLVWGGLSNAAGCWPSKLPKDGGRIHPGHQVERNNDSDKSKAQTRAMAVCTFHVLHNWLCKETVYFIFGVSCRKKKKDFSLMLKLKRTKKHVTIGLHWIVVTITEVSAPLMTSPRTKP